MTTVFVNLQGLPTGATAINWGADLFRLLAQYGGYLCRIGQIGERDPGGTLLLFWGAPASHENDVTRALHFALALQAAAPSPMRIGVTTALAYAGFVGSPLSEEYTCYGAHVNLAARQMVMAGWGEIWLDDETARLAGPAFVIQGQGQRQFKGFAEEQPVYRLLYQQVTALDQHYAGELVGRAAELAQLHAALAPLLEGAHVGLLAISGEAGMGKSRLVHELRVASGGWQVAGVSTHHPPPATQWFLCQTDEILRQPLNPFRYWLRRYFNQSTSADEATNKAVFTAKLDELIAYVTSVNLQSPASSLQSSASGLVAELDRTRSFLGALVDLHWPNSLYAQVEPQLRFENTRLALKSLIQAESLRRPVVLHLEDAHWLDGDSQTFLGQLLRNGEDYPFVIIATLRPNEVGMAADNEAGFFLVKPRLTIHLTTLTVDEVATLATAHLQGPPTPVLLSLLWERAEGDPFFAEQLLHYLQEQDLLIQSRNGWQLRSEQATAILLPEGARALLVARLDRLPQPVKEVVQTAAVLGREFDTPILAQMLVNDAELTDKLAVADAAAIWSAISQARYLFRHALLREAAYEMQLRARLRQLHRQAGDAIRTVFQEQLTPHYATLAYHFDQAEVVEQAIHWYGLAGTKALDLYSNQEALRYFTRALDLTAITDGDTRYHLLLGSEAAKSWLGHRAAQLQTIEELEVLTTHQADLTKLATVALRRAAYASQIGQRPMALSAAATAVHHASGAGTPLLEAQAYHRWGRVGWETGDYTSAQRHLERGLLLARTQQSLLVEAQCLYDLGTVAYYIDDYATAQGYLENAAKIYANLQDRQGEIRCLSLSGGVLDNWGDHSNALQQYDQALHLAQVVGWRYAEARLLNQSGDNLLQLGDLVASRHRLERALVICREIDDQAAVASTLDMLGLVAFAEGQLNTAQNYFTNALTIVQTQNNRRSQGYTLTHLGHVLADLGQNDQALALLQRALTLRTEDKAQALRLDTLAALAHLHFIQGELGAAHQHVKEILANLAEHGEDGIEFPIQVYLRCYLVLNAITQRSEHTVEQAATVLAAGHALLMARANRLRSEQLQQQFLNNLPFNRELHTLWLARSMTT